MSIKVTKYILLVVGIILIACAAFLVIATRKYNYNVVSFDFKGLDATLWWIIAFAAVILAAIGFFFNSLAAKIIYYSLFGIAVVFIGLVIKLTTASFMNFSTVHFKAGFYVTMTGFLLTNLATIISLHRPYVKTKPEAIDLLDT